MLGRKLYAAQVQEPTPEATFAARMRDARMERGMTQLQVSELVRTTHGIEIDPTGILRMEKGQRSPRLDEAIAIADVLGIQLWDLIGPALPAQDSPPRTIAEAEAAIEIITVELAKLDAEWRKARQESVNAHQQWFEIRRSAEEIDARRVELAARRQSLHAAIEEMRKKQS